MTGDLFTAVALREAGLNQVARNAGAAFMDKGLAIIATMSGEVQGEDIRKKLTAMGIVPHTHKAWGALINRAVRSGLLIGTGRFPPTNSPKTHSHRTQIYRVRA